ncbi:uncharacterized protein BT62DRAFT_293952 [Guyanagaster necrorhizus]|uniref:PEHE domain-containing protein n=1 Tax=Guyanagaster necrorhizus TaxID=856835 RepID=A0A9P7W483_9AGAR|nr:uncharacterized protein BT62DRAFT_293952 [Guyanagaster necrorhizus MCA 3950]KAG7452274.1 hypothetical protein BT62DRAFT_293952 [Guyanagaster necrorhizus MCA 3950]
MNSTPSTSVAPSGRQTRQKRVNPSRSGKGGPGIGNCEADTLILDTQKRQLENEPLIPANTLFFMTTNLELLPESSSSSDGQVMFNTHANERYFDRPEVMQSYRLQQSIETPDFTELSQTHVGGRFRPRGSDDTTHDTSDAYYEKRHRKYETMEKRQRLREKEQLKYEQYKLKERIEQLRGMDAMGFLTLPAETFTPKPLEEENAELPSISASGFHINNPSLYKEGERRRKEMLDTATTLEERYRVLLPPDKKNHPKKHNKESQKKVPRQGIEIRVSEEVQSEWEENEVEEGENQREAEEADMPLQEEVLHNEKPVPLTIKVPPRVSSTVPTPAPTPPAISVPFTKTAMEAKSVFPTNPPPPTNAVVPVKAAPPLPKKRRKADPTPSILIESPPPFRPTWSGTRLSPFLSCPPSPAVILSSGPTAGSSSLSPVSVIGPDETPGSPVSPLFDELTSATPTLSNPEIATLDISIKSVSSSTSEIDYLVEKPAEEPDFHVTTDTGRSPRKRGRYSYTYSATQLVKESVSAPLPRSAARVTEVTASASPAASPISAPKAKAPGVLLSAALKRNQNNPRGSIIRHYVAWGVKLGPERKGEEKEYEIPREIREESLVAAVMAKIEAQCPDVDEGPPETVEGSNRRRTRV